MRTPPDRERRRAQDAWCWYDVANSGFQTSVVSAILPPFFASVAGRTMPSHEATALWGYASAAALAAAAVLAPLIGAAADQLGRRKPLLTGCVVVGAAGTAALALAAAEPTALLTAFAVAFIAFAMGNVLYDALLPAVAHADEMHRLSARGFAWGYLGGGALLALHAALLLMPQRFGLAGMAEAARVAFASTALWWVLFTLPLLRRVPEPPAERTTPSLAALPAAVLGQLANTFRHIRRRPQLLQFLLAFWAYSDGIGTIVKMASIYGAELGFGTGHLIGALLLVQVLAAPAAVLFARMAGPLGPQRAVIAGLIGYAGITVFAYRLSEPWHFWALAAMVAMVQGGTQALSRSMFASLVPRAQMGEMFGFYSVSEKLAGVVGPLVFGLVTQATGGGRSATLTLLPFFLVGAWLLSRVDLARGAAEAAEG